MKFDKLIDFAIEESKKIYNNPDSTESMHFRMGIYDAFFYIDATNSFYESFKQLLKIANNRNNFLNNDTEQHYMNGAMVMYNYKKTPNHKQ